MRRTFFGILLLTAVVAAAGCDNEVEDATQPSPPAPTTTDTFTGSMNINGAQIHSFTVQASGTVNVTLKEVKPDPAIAVGLSLGTWNGTSCAERISNNNALQGNAVVGNTTGIGALCVRIHDVGKLTQTIEYTIEVVHP